MIRLYNPPPQKCVRCAQSLRRVDGSTIHGKDATTLKRPFHQRRSPTLPAARLAAGSCAALVALILVSSPLGEIRAEIELPVGSPEQAIVLGAEAGRSWQQGSYEVWYLRGCQLRQGGMIIEGAEGIAWVEPGDPALNKKSRVLLYVEGPGLTFKNQSESGLTAMHANYWYGQLESSSGVTIAVKRTRLGNDRPAVYERALAARRGEVPTGVWQAQFSEPTEPGVGETKPRGGTNLRLGNFHVQIQGRSNVNWDLQLQPDPNGGETIAIAKNGIKAIFEGIEVPGVGSIGTVSLETDSMVAWAADKDASRDAGDDKLPLELYLEGNVIFRQANRVIYADRMYYNVTDDFGVVLNAEILTPIPEYNGLLRLKADVLRQVDKQHFIAYGAALTTSRLGVPRYWFQAEEVKLVDIQTTQLDPLTGRVLLDPDTREPVVTHNMMATSRDNFLYLGGVPIFYWPVMATNLTSPSYYIDRLKVKSDSVYGVQFLADWDARQLLGVENAREGTRWTISTDLLSKRGFGIGTLYQYDVNEMFRLPGPAQGRFDAWGLKEQGLDNLGADRRALVPERDFRGRLLWTHRQLLGNGYQLTAEIGLISDRNFLEQYYEHEWDEQKDQATGVELKRYDENASWSIAADVRTNDFFTQTEWFPRFDHYLVGQSLLGDRLSWQEHTRVGFARLRTAGAPADPIDAAKFDPLAGEAGNPQGIVASSRQEISMPLKWNSIKIAPYLLGEAAFYGNDINGADASRLLGQVGVRANLVMWQARQEIRSRLFNVNGLAHKVIWHADLYWADANQDMDQFPRYDALDDDSIEHFRRRFFFDTFAGSSGGNVHPKWDERFFALRSNMQGSVTAASGEIVDDMLAARLGVHQRWQTKRGVIGRERIVDWIVLDVEGTLFPSPNRDNFGQHLGLLDYDFRWHLGDRFTVLSDGYADFFGDGLQMVTIGGLMSRPERGRFYLGYRSIGGPISSSVVHASLTYRMGDKWAAIAGTSFDLGSTGNIGQRLDLVKIGESALIRFGISMDESRDNLGIHLSIEPRFLASQRF